MKIKHILKEFGDPEGQYTTTAAPVTATPEPNKGFAVRLTGLAGTPDKAAQMVWAALSSVLPKDFPAGDGEGGYSLRAQELVNRLVRSKQPQAIKGGLTKDVAETIASKITNWPANGKIPTDVVEQ
jgi:hypothetical protein